MGTREFRAGRLERVLRVTSFRDVNGYSDVLQIFRVVSLRVTFHLHVFDYPEADHDPEFEFKDAPSGNGFHECYSHKREIVRMGQIYQFFARDASFKRYFIYSEEF
ncbi:hypothetical protein PTKU15_84450 [Paraburkholderia terrae]|nr:hypothetical protein PTKU15_84450 [Paraburkholderia terrae]